MIDLVPLSIQCIIQFPDGSAWPDPADCGDIVAMKAGFDERATEIGLLKVLLKSIWNNGCTVVLAFRLTVIHGYGGFLLPMESNSIESHQG